MRTALLGLILLAQPAVACPRGAEITVHAFFDLPRADERSHGISGVTWDAANQALLAVGDKRPALLAIEPEPGFRRFRLGASTPLDVGRRWDAEAIALAGDRVFVGNEAGPWIHVVTRQGKLDGEIALPDSFARARHNQGLESLAASPDGRFLFVANEHAFEGDGGEGDADRGTTVRLTRIELATRAAAQHRYLSDPVFSRAPDGRVGVVELAALSSSRLLVLERAFVPGEGNGVRLYCVDLPARPAAGELPKTLLVDVGRLPDAGVPAPSQPQRNRLLDNFEALAVGPPLADGRRLLFLASDDNNSHRQVPRILVLAASGL
jgi:hypothetical protein